MLTYLVPWWADFWWLRSCFGYVKRLSQIEQACGLSDKPCFSILWVFKNFLKEKLSLHSGQTYCFLSWFWGSWHVFQCFWSEYLLANLASQSLQGIWLVLAQSLATWVANWKIAWKFVKLLWFSAVWLFSTSIWREKL